MPGGSSTITDLSDSFLQEQGQQSKGLSSEGNFKNRLVYPAIVIRDEDPSDSHRIIARIVSISPEGEIKGGRDRDVPDDKLPFCLPLESQILYMKPLEGEMVFVVLENPESQTSLRYWKGPIITNKKKLSFQGYKDSRKIYNRSTFFANETEESSNPEALAQFPDKGDIALQGRQDSDIMLKPREVFTVAGKFQKDTFQRNDISPSFLQLKQFSEPISETENENRLDQFSQANLQSTNINLFSPRGKFRDPSLAELENNDDLNNFGENAKQLHPVVFGDELIRLLDLMRRVLLNHIHTPHKPALETEETQELNQYTIDGRLQDIISKHVRTN